MCLNISFPSHLVGWFVPVQSGQGLPPASPAAPLHGPGETQHPGVCVSWEGGQGHCQAVGMCQGGRSAQSWDPGGSGDTLGTLGALGTPWAHSGLWAHSGGTRGSGVTLWSTAQRWVGALRVPQTPLHSPWCRALCWWWAPGQPQCPLPAPQALCPLPCWVAELAEMSQLDADTPVQAAALAQCQGSWLLFPVCCPWFRCF